MKEHGGRGRGGRGIKRQIGKEIGSHVGARKIIIFELKFM